MQYKNWLLLTIVFWQEDCVQDLLYKQTCLRVPLLGPAVWSRCPVLLFIFYLGFCGIMQYKNWLLLMIVFWQQDCVQDPLYKPSCCPVLLSCSISGPVVPFNFCFCGVMQCTNWLLFFWQWDCIQVLLYKWSCCPIVLSCSSVLVPSQAPRTSLLCWEDHFIIVCGNISIMWLIVMVSMYK